MKRQYNSKKFSFVAIFLVLIAMVVSMLSIGFSAFQASLDISKISAIIRAQKDIRITGIISSSATSSAMSNWEEYTVRTITSTVYLPYEDSTITYNIQVTNVGNVMQGIYSIDEIYKIYDITNGSVTNVNSNLEIKNKTVTLKEALCDNTNSSKCKLGSVTTFSITIGYAANGYDGTNKNHSIELDFDFRRVFDITYSGFSNVSGLPSQMIYGDTKEITFTSTTGIPSNVLVSGATGSYSSPNLILSNITITGIDDSIVVTKLYSITYSGFDGDTSGLISSISVTGGTIEFNLTTGLPTSVTVTGATGNYNSTTHFLTLSNITGDITITASSGGGSGGNGGTWEEPVEDTTTTTFDPGNVPEGTTVYVNVDGAPKVTADENGNITQFEYTDTGSGVSVPSGGLDTGVLAFDGNDFVVTLKAKFTFANCTASICPIINVSKKDPDVNGILIYEYREPKSGYGHDSSGSNVQPPFNKFRFGKYENSKSTGNVDYNISSKVTASQGSARYGYNSSSSSVTLTIKLYYTNGVFTSEIYNSSGSNNVLLAKPYNNTTYSFSNPDASFNNITVVIGQYDGFGEGVSYTHNFSILEFNVTKTIN